MSDKEQVPKHLDRELSIYVEGGKKNFKRARKSNTLPEGTDPSRSPSGWQMKRCECLGWCSQLCEGNAE